MERSASWVKTFSEGVAITRIGVGEYTVVPPANIGPLVNAVNAGMSNCQIQLGNGSTAKFATISYGSFNTLVLKTYDVNMNPVDGWQAYLKIEWRAN